MRFSLDLDIARFDVQAPPPSMASRAFNGKIEKNLIDLSRIALNQPNLVFEIISHADVLTDETLDHFSEWAICSLRLMIFGSMICFRENPIIDPSAKRRVPPPIDFQDVLQERIFRRQVSLNHREKRECRSNIVERRDTSGQTADRLHFLGLAQLFFQFGFFGLRRFSLGNIQDDSPGGA
jgi:hypothetical protein